MKLELHLIPKTSFFVNLRKKIGRDWQRLSRRVRASKHFTCELCGWKEVPGKYTHLHELWEFDEKSKTQKLVGFECVCPDCHAVHHWCHSQFIGKNMDALINHACTVNNCSRAAFEKHISKSLAQWEKRSEIKWLVDTSYYVNMRY